MSELSFEQMLEDSLKLKVSARGRNDSTAREIYETVYNDVMKDVQENLSQMKPQLIQEVVDSAAQKVIDKYEQRFKQLEQKISKMERSLQSGNLSNNTKVNTNNSNGNVSNKAAKIDVSRINDGFKFDGWIYYPNENMGNFLYKVREDGSENTQLTNYSVIGLFSVSNGYLNFSDADYEGRKIKI